jgi:MFS family permease
VLHAFVTQELSAPTLGFALLQRLGPQAHLSGQVLGIDTFTGLLLGTQRVSEPALGPTLGRAADRYGRAPVLFAGLGMGAGAALALLGARSAAAVGAAVLLYWLGAAPALIALDASAADLAHRADGAWLRARYAT